MISFNNLHHLYFETPIIEQCCSIKNRLH